MDDIYLSLTEKIEAEREALEVEKKEKEAKKPSSIYDELGIVFKSYYQ